MLKILRWLPAAIWALAILWMCTLPPSKIPKYPFLANIPVDKAVHLFLFAGMAFLLAWIYHFSYTGTIVAIIVSCIYGLIIEWIQWKFVAGRSAEIADFVADAIGALSLLVFYYIKKEKLR